MWSAYKLLAYILRMVPPVEVSASLGRRMVHRTATTEHLSHRSVLYSSSVPPIQQVCGEAFVGRYELLLVNEPSAHIFFTPASVISLQQWPLPQQENTAVGGA